MNTVSTYLNRVIVYEGRNKCLVCSQTRELVRKDYHIDARDPLQIPMGLSSDYPRDVLQTVPPIPEPDPLRTTVCCANKNCLAKWDVEKINGMKVINDSASENNNKARKEHFKNFLDTDSTDSE